MSLSPWVLVTPMRKKAIQGNEPWNQRCSITPWEQHWSYYFRAVLFLRKYLSFPISAVRIFPSYWFCSLNSIFLFSMLLKPPQCVWTTVWTILQFLFRNTAEPLTVSQTQRDYPKSLVIPFATETIIVLLETHKGGHWGPVCGAAHLRPPMAEVSHTVPCVQLQQGGSSHGG